MADYNHAPPTGQHPSWVTVHDAKLTRELVRLDPRTGDLYVTAAGTNAVLEIDPQREVLRRQLPSGHHPLDCLIVP